MAFIPEGDVYRLIVHSRMPGAERFEKWVFDEVLPMIRKTGGYMTASLLEQAAEKPEILLAFADQLLAEHEKNRQLSGEVERLRPKADFYDAFVHEENCTNIRATAKELQIGERAFCRFLMDAGFLYRCPAGYLLPYAKPSNDGLCELDAFYVECENDEPEPGGGRQEEYYLIPGSGFRLLVSELHMFLVTWYSIAKCLSQAQNEKDFLRLQKKYGNYEKTLNRLRRKLGLSADSNFCQDELEAAVIKRFRAELIPGEQIGHE